jgi:predicted enzyme related to lactoylglutathione lyase
MPDPNAQPNPRWRIAPYFIVEDVVTTANFYRDKLGFEYERFWGDPPCFAMVSRNGATIMLKQPETPGFMRHNQISAKDTAGGDFAWDAYLWIDDADALYAHCQANGVKIVRPICDQDYEMRDFDIEDCNGFRLCFGHDISK